MVVASATLATARSESTFSPRSGDWRFADEENSEDYLHAHRPTDGTHSPHPMSLDTLDTHFDEETRRIMGIKGLVPPAVEGFSKQEKRCMLFTNFPPLTRNRR